MRRKIYDRTLSGNDPPPQAVGGHLGRRGRHNFNPAAGERRPGLPRYLDSFLFGTGAATLASGMVNFFRKNDLLRDETRLRKAAIVELDERNLEITRRACALTLNILLIVMYAAMVVSAFFSWTVCFTLLAALCVSLLAMLICFIVVAKNL